MDVLPYQDTPYFVNLSQCLRLGLFMSYLCGLFFHYHFHYNESYNLIETDKLLLNMFVKSSTSEYCLVFA